MSEKYLILHSENGERLHGDSLQKMTFKLQSPIRLEEEGDYYMGLAGYNIETEGQLHRLDCSLMYNKQHLPLIIHCADIFDLVGQLNEAIKTFDPISPAKLNLVKKTMKLTIVTRQSRFRILSNELTKVLGMNRDNFKPNMRYTSHFEPSLPSLLDFYITIDCIDSNTSVPTAKGQALVPMLCKLTAPVPSIDEKLTRIQWCKINKHAIQMVTVTFYYMQTGHVVNCYPWLDQWTLSIVYKRCLQLNL